jgi:hypothetical protein
MVISLVIVVLGIIGAAMVRLDRDVDPRSR